MYDVHIKRVWEGCFTPIIDEHTSEYGDVSGVCLKYCHCIGEAARRMRRLKALRTRISLHVQMEIAFYHAGYM